MTNKEKLPPVGAHGMCNGYPATVVRHYYGMLEVRVPGGLVCVDKADFKPNGS